MIEYVAGFMFDALDRVALVRKLKPEWQRGLLNGIGGKIEPGETPIAAMRREWLEETSNDHRDWFYFVSTRGKSSLVHYFTAIVAAIPPITAFNDIGERNEIHGGRLVIARPDVVPNLRWQIPLALDREDFSVEIANSTTIYGALPVGLPKMQEQPRR